VFNEHGGIADMCNYYLKYLIVVWIVAAWGSGNTMSSKAELPVIGETNQSQQLISDFSYTYLAADGKEYMPKDDPAGAILKDGRKTSKSRVIFIRPPENKVKIGINFPCFYHVNAIKIYSQRPNNQYHISKIRYYVNNSGNEEFLGEEPGYGISAKEAEFITLDFKGQKAKSLVLEIYTGQVALTEIEIFGSKADEKEKVTNQDAGTILNGNTLVAAAECDLNKDGKKQVVLENSYVRLVFDPQQGGECVSFIHKKANKEFVNDRMLRDQFWAPDEKNMFKRSAYLYQILNKENEVSLQMSCGGVGQFFMLELQKTITIQADKSSIKVEYELKHKAGANTDALSLGFWLWNALGGPTYNYITPTDNGILREQLEGQPKAIWHYNLSRGWNAMIDKDGNGLAFELDYKMLDCVYYWPGTTVEWRFRKFSLPSGKSLTTTYYVYPVQEVLEVQSVFDGIVGTIKKLKDKYQENEPVDLSVTINPCQKKQIELFLRYKILPAEQWHEISSLKLDVQPDQPQEFKTTVPGQKAGTIVVNCEVRSANKVIGDFETPVQIGDRNTQQYRMPASEERIGFSGEKNSASPQNDEKVSFQVNTPHQTWKPYQGGTINAVVLTDYCSEIEIGELAQRMDIQIDSSRYADMEEYRKKFKSSNSSLSDIMNKKEHDVILISGLDWKRCFDEQVRNQILEKVRNGMGLVFVNPTDIDENLAKALSIDGQPVFTKGMQSWKKEGNHYITAGLPFEAMPHSEHWKYKTTSNMVVLAKSGEDPLISIGNYGAGRVVLLAYNVYVNPGNIKFNDTGLTPYRIYFPFPWVKTYGAEYEPEGHHPVDLQTTFTYWEYYYSLLSKAVLWAGKKEPKTQIKSLEVTRDSAAPATHPQPGKLKFTLCNTSEVFPAQLILRMTGRYGEEQSCWSNSLSVSKGENTYECEIPEQSSGDPLSYVGVCMEPGRPRPVFPGLGSLAELGQAGRLQSRQRHYSGGFRLIDMKILDSEHKVLDWGTCLDNPVKPVYIGNITVNYPEAKQHLQPDGKMTGSVAIESFGVGANEGTNRLVLELYDGYDRLVGIQTADLLLDNTKKTNNVSFEFASASGSANGCGNGRRIVAKLMKNDILMDDYKSEVIPVCQAISSNDFYISMTGASPTYSHVIRDYLAPGYYQKAGEVTSGILQDAEPRTYLHNFSLITQRMPTFWLGHAGRADYAKKAPAYAATKDKKYLVKEPCFSDPAYMDGMCKETEKSVARYYKYFGGMFAYFFTDELSLTSWSSFFDFCYCKHCLKLFREWLKNDYKTIEALNMEWGASFKNWDEVVPMTRQEVESRGDNWAPYVDHRRFMDTVIPNAIKRVKDSIRSADPNGRIWICGTQVPLPGVGMDYWRMSRVVDDFQPYGDANMPEILRSFALPGTCILPNVGASKNKDSWSPLALWYGLFNFQGINVYNFHSTYNSDLTCGEHSGAAALEIFAGEVKGGVGKLIHDAQRMDDRIAIHYSQSSILVGPTEYTGGIHQATREGWTRLLDDLGFGYKFVSYEEIEKGALIRENYRVLILPHSKAISRAEAENIREFVRKGGLLIGDYEIGLMDEHGRTQKTGQLDDVFGIKRSGNNPLNALADVRIDERLSGGLKGDEGIARLSIMEGGIATDKGISYGTTKDKAPAIIINKTGKGQGVYLNFHLGGYLDERLINSPRNKTWRHVFRNIFALHDVKPVVAIDCKESFFAGSVTRFKKGDHEYVGVLRDGSDDRPISKTFDINLNKMWHVYNVRKGKYYGKVDRIVDELATGDAALYALLPYEVNDIDLKVDQQSARPGDKVACHISLNKRSGITADHVVNIEVFDPNMKKHALYSGNCVCGDKGGVYDFTLALNDPAGTWRVKARDVISGKIFMCDLNVKSR